MAGPGSEFLAQGLHVERQRVALAGEAHAVELVDAQGRLRQAQVDVDVFGEKQRPGAEPEVALAAVRG